MVPQPEKAARTDIDNVLTHAGWVVCDATEVNLTASRGVAVREFPLKAGHGFAFGDARYKIESGPRPISPSSARFHYPTRVMRHVGSIESLRHLQLEAARELDVLFRAVLDRGFKGELL